jgi:hypothetical protein
VKTVYDDANQQLKITPIFTIENAKGLKCLAVAYFYQDNGIPLRDKNKLYYTVEGNVSGLTEFTPAYNVSLYDNSETGLTIILPYKELELTKGFYKLKFKVILFDDKVNQVISSQYYSFTFTQN